MQENQSQHQPQGNSKENRKSRRGFASMDKDRHKAVSSKGGQSPRAKAGDRLKHVRSTYEGF